MNFKEWLRGAELIDSYRVVPRVFLFACFIWAVHITYLLLRWYMLLPAEERGLEASGFASVALIGVLGFLKLVYESYSRAGRDWNSVPPSTSSTIVSSTTTTGAPPP